MKTKVIKLLIAAIFVSVSSVFAQPLIIEDRRYVKVSADVVSMEQDIYLPSLRGSKPKRFIRWEYQYKNKQVLTERSFSAAKGTLWTEQKFAYTDDGKLVKDSCYDPSYPKFDYYTVYEYGKNGLLEKVTTTNRLSGKVDRVDTYKKYKDAYNYECVTKIYGDDIEFKYTSVFENGLKRKVIHTKEYIPVTYEYDTAGRLIAKNSRKYFYKLDKKGNAIAAVEIERGMKTYNFMRLTYADGTVTGSLEPDEEFISKWDSEK
jgi:hypothetical protein